MNPARQAALSRPPPSSSPSSSLLKKKGGRKYDRKVQEEEELEMKWQAHRAKLQAHTPAAPATPPSYLPPSLRPPPPTSVPAPLNGAHLSEEQHLSLYHLLSYPPNSLPPPSPPFLALLSSQLSSLTSSLTPQPSDLAAKQAVIDRIRAAIRPLWGEEADVLPFGSFCTGLSLPHSDIDVALRLPLSTPKTVASDLRDVQTAITCQSFERLPSFRLLSRARIPILRYVDEDRGVKVDLCVNREDGVKAVGVMKGYGERYPQVRPLVLALKLLLKRVGLNEVYSGGVSSYILQLMTIFFLQVYTMAQGHSQQQPDTATPGEEGKGNGEGQGGGKEDEAELGRLFFSFLDFYGNRFDYVNYGIMLGPLPSDEQPEPPTCSYFSKMERGWVDVEHPGLLSIEDPVDATHDVASSCFGIGRVQRCFSLAHERLCMMSAEWEHTGQITPLVNPTSDAQQQGKADDSKEATHTNGQHAEKANADDDEAADEKKAKKAKAKKRQPESSSDDDDEDNDGVDALAALSPLERKVREDDARVLVGPILSVLFTRQLYVSQVLIDHEDAKAKEKTAGVKVAPMDAKALKRAAKRERRRQSGKVVPEEADVKPSDPSKVRKRTKKEKKARKLEKRRQRAEGESGRTGGGEGGGEEAQAADQSEALEEKREKKRRKVKAEAQEEEAKEEAVVEEGPKSKKKSKKRRAESEEVKADVDGVECEAQLPQAEAKTAAEPGELPVERERKKEKNKKEKKRRAQSEKVKAGDEGAEAEGQLLQAESTTAAESDELAVEGKKKKRRKEKRSKAEANADNHDE